VATCLAKDPDQRWQSASDVVRELTWIAESPGATVAAQAHVVRQAWWRQALPVVAASLVVALVTWIGTRPGGGSPVRFSVSVPPDQALCCPEITPDGRTVAFHGLNPPPRPQLFLRRLDQLEVVSLPGSERNRETFPEFFSPDGEWLLIAEA